MQSDDIECLLADDFAALSKELEQDRFVERIEYKLLRKSRARQGAIFFAGGLGAAFAVAQFAGAADTFARIVADTPAASILANGDYSQLAATLLLGAALTATMLVMRMEG